LAKAAKKNPKLLEAARKKAEYGGDDTPAAPQDPAEKQLKTTASDLAAQAKALKGFLEKCNTIAKNLPAKEARLAQLKAELEKEDSKIQAKTATSFLDKQSTMMSKLDKTELLLQHQLQQLAESKQQVLQAMSANKKTIDL